MCPGRREFWLEGTRRERTARRTREAGQASAGGRRKNETHGCFLAVIPKQSVKNTDTCTLGPNDVSLVAGSEKSVRSLPGSRIHLNPSGDSRKQSYSCAFFCRRFWFQVTKQRQVQTSTCCQSSRLTEPVYLLILNGWLQTSGDTFNTVTVKYTQGGAKQMAGGHMDNSKHVASEYLDTQVLEVWFKTKADVTCGNEQRLWFYTTKMAENL